MHRLNGVPVEDGAVAFDLSDRGLTLGDGLFETIAVFGGRPALLDAHLASRRRHRLYHRHPRNLPRLRARRLLLHDRPLLRRRRAFFQAEEFSQGRIQRHVAVGL